MLQGGVFLEHSPMLLWETGFFFFFFTEANAHWLASQ